MRPRELATSSPLVEAYGATQLAVSLGSTVKAIMQNPELGGRAAAAWEVADAQSQGFTDEQREAFRTRQAEIDRQIYQVEWDLNHSVYDPVEREGLFNQLDELQKQTEQARSSITQESIDAGRLMSPEAFQEQYGEFLEYTGPITPQAAELLYQGRKDEIIRNAIIEAGPKGLGPGVVKFGASILNIATDPAELATMFVPVVGPVAKARLVTRLGPVAGRAAVGAIEGGVGSLMTEPLYYGFSKNLQLDYAMEDALFNVGAGFFLGGGIGTIAGAYARKGIDTKAVSEMIEPETRVIGGDPVELPAMERVSDEAIMAAEPKARAQTQRMVAALNGPKTMQHAISQLVTDQGVSVELVMPRTMPRPQSLSEFIRAKGGINDKDPTFRGELQYLGIQGRAQYFNSRGTRVSGISNPNAQNNLDDMAQLAREAGFIGTDNTDELIDALRQEQSGDFVFSMRDSQMAADWRQYNQARNDYEAEIEHRNAIRNELEAIGYKNASDDEVALISEYMASRGMDLEAAAERVAIQAEGLMAATAARRAIRPDLDPFADLAASARAAATPEDVDFNAAIERDLAIVRQMEENGQLTDTHRAILDEINKIDAKADAYIRNLQAGIACIVRT
jgi:hypothetical protein